MHPNRLFWSIAAIVAIALILVVACNAQAGIDLTGFYLQPEVVQKQVGVNPSVELYEHYSSSVPFAKWARAYDAMLQRGCWVLVKPGIVGVRDIRGQGGNLDRITLLRWNERRGGVFFNSADMKPGEYLLSLFVDHKDGRRNYLFGLISVRFMSRDEKGIFLTIVDRDQPLTSGQRKILAQSSGFISLLEIPERPLAETTVQIASIALWSSDPKYDRAIRAGSVIVNPDNLCQVKVAVGQGNCALLRYLLTGDNMKFSDTPGWTSDGSGGIYQDSPIRSLTIKPWFAGAIATLTVCASDGQSHWGTPASVQITVAGGAQ